MEAAVSEKGSVNAVIAFLMGFTFSFAWTPCISLRCLPFAAGVILRQSLGVHLPDDCIRTGVYNSLPDIGIVYRKGTALDFQS